MTNLTVLLAARQQADQTHGEFMILEVPAARFTVCRS